MLWQFLISYCKVVCQVWLVSKSYSFASFISLLLRWAKLERFIRHGSCYVFIPNRRSRRTQWWVALNFPESQASHAVSCCSPVWWAAALRNAECCMIQCGPLSQAAAEPSLTSTTQRDTGGRDGGTGRLSVTDRYWGGGTWSSHRTTNTIFPDFTELYEE